MRLFDQDQHPCLLAGLFARDLFREFFWLLLVVVVFFWGAAPVRWFERTPKGQATVFWEFKSYKQHIVVWENRHLGSLLKKNRHHLGENHQFLRPPQKSHISAGEQDTSLGEGASSTKEIPSKTGGSQQDLCLFVDPKKVVSFNKPCLFFVPPKKQ